MGDKISEARTIESRNLAFDKNCEICIINYDKHDNVLKVLSTRKILDILFLYLIMSPKQLDGSQDSLGPDL